MSMSNDTAERVAASGADTTDWARVYRACRLSEQGVSLQDFLAAPWRILHEHGQEGAPASMREGFLPLLPAQAAIARRLIEGEVSTWIR